MLDLTLGRVLRLQLVRRHQNDRASITRGLLAVGDGNAVLPERNMNVAVNLERADLDFWPGILEARANGASREASVLPPSPAPRHRPRRPQ